MSIQESTPRTVNGVDVDALGQTIAAIAERPELGAARFESASRWTDDRRVTTTIDPYAAGGGEHRRAVAHELRTDVPPALTGTDQGPSPLEVALAALSSCVTTTLVAHAAAKGQELRSLEVSVSGDIDLRGFLNLAEVRTGYGGLEVHVALDADLSEDEIERFIDSGLRFSPVLDLFRRGTPVVVASEAG